MKDFIDDRGEIRNVEHSAWIFTEKGAVRSNHYHKEGWHYLEVKHGRVRYLERDVGGGNEVEKEIGTGGVVFTPPMREHRVEFLEDTLMRSDAAKKAGGDYEKDTVPVEW